MTENDRPEQYTGEPMGISEAIREVTNWYVFNTGCTFADEIMSGCCREFADSVIERVHGAELGYGCGHCWIEYNGLVYDAEAPNGVEHSDELPFFAVRAGESAWLN